VASFAWRLALAAWPELPYIDRRVLETAAGMPLERIRGRRVQRELLARRFPLLARLPLDTNSRRMSLVTVTWRGRIRVWFEATRFARRVVHRSAERRYYFRVYNIHNPGWDAVRRAAESGRHAVHAMFDAEQLARMLPPPGVRIDARDAIIDGSRYKSLLGLMLLAAPRQ
jgi:asparagine synthase (glutamine-hydrolysing)